MWTLRVHRVVVERPSGTRPIAPIHLALGGEGVAQPDVGVRVERPELDGLAVRLDRLIEEPARRRSGTGRRAPCRARGRSDRAGSRRGTGPPPSSDCRAFWCTTPSVYWATTKLGIGLDRPAQEIDGRFVALLARRGSRPGARARRARTRAASAWSARPTSGPAPAPTSVAGTFSASSVGRRQRPQPVEQLARPPPSKVSRAPRLDLSPCSSRKRGWTTRSVPVRFDPPEQRERRRRARLACAAAAASSHASGCGRGARTARARSGRARACCTRREHRAIWATPSPIHCSSRVELHGGERQDQRRCAAWTPRSAAAAPNSASSSAGDDGRDRSSGSAPSCSWSSSCRRPRRHSAPTAGRTPRARSAAARSSGIKQHRHDAHEPRPDLHRDPRLAPRLSGTRPAARPALPPPVSSASSRRKISSTPRSRSS